MENTHMSESTETPMAHKKPVESTTTNTPRVARAISRASADFAPPGHATPQPAHTITRRESPPADVCHNLSPWTTFRSLLFYAPGRETDG